jgi:hypothetical protein
MYYVFHVYLGDAKGIATRLDALAREAIEFKPLLLSSQKSFPLLFCFLATDSIPPEIVNGTVGFIVAVIFRPSYQGQMGLLDRYSGPQPCVVC